MPQELEGAAAMDADGDGIVTQEEMFRSIAGENGEISREEFAKAMTAMGHGDNVAAMTDRDGKNDVFEGNMDSLVRTQDGVLRFKRDGTKHCTDPKCLCIFLAFQVGMAIIAGIAIDQGKPARLLYATDGNGATCGKDFPGKEHIYYPELEKDMLAFAATAMMHPELADPRKFHTSGVCMNGCPAKDSMVTMNGQDYDVMFKTKSTFFRCFPQVPASDHSAAAPS
jgi:hypothetical protein